MPQEDLDAPSPQRSVNSRLPHVRACALVPVDELSRIFELDLNQVTNMPWHGNPDDQPVKSDEFDAYPGLDASSGGDEVSEMLQTSQASYCLYSTGLDEVAVAGSSEVLITIVDMLSSDVAKEYFAFMVSDAQTYNAHYRSIAQTDWAYFRKWIDLGGGAALGCGSRLVFATATGDTEPSDDRLVDLLGQIAGAAC